MAGHGLSRIGEIASEAKYSIHGKDNLEAPPTSRSSTASTAFQAFRAVATRCLWPRSGSFRLIGGLHVFRHKRDGSSYSSDYLRGGLRLYWTLFGRTKHFFMDKEAEMDRQPKLEILYPERHGNIIRIAVRNAGGSVAKGCYGKIKIEHTEEEVLATPRDTLATG